MKRWITGIFTVALLLCCMIPTASAQDEEALTAARLLNQLGLFRGTGTTPSGYPIYDLDKQPTRNQAIIMLVRLMGQEETASSQVWEIPFTDVPDTLRTYIGYAYNAGLTNGTTATTYSGTAPIRENQYITFVLRAMGYISGQDFQVSSPWELSDQLKITNGPKASGEPFTRGDIALISNRALDAVCKDTGMTLLETLGLVRPTEPLEPLPPEALEPVAPPAPEPQTPAEPEPQPPAKPEPQPEKPQAANLKMLTWNIEEGLDQLSSCLEDCINARLAQAKGSHTRGFHATVTACLELGLVQQNMEYAVSYCGADPEFASTKRNLQYACESLERITSQIDVNTIADWNYDIYLPRIENCASSVAKDIEDAVNALP